MSRPYRVCVVCAGNICRSPMVEAVLRAKLEEAGLADQVVVDSAGTGAWHVGDGAHPQSTGALARRGYTLEHRARQFDTRWFADRDLVLALDRQNHADLLALAPPGHPRGRLRLLRSYGAPPEIDPHDGTWAEGDVPDPWGHGDDAYEHALDLVETACDALVAQLVRELGASRPGDDRPS